MATYLKNNPSLMVGIDGYANGSGSSVNQARVDTIRNALIADGVSSDRITTGAFGDPKLHRSSRVEVLIKTR